MISIVIPCFNAAETIAETIESALSQEVDLELIVVNDGSTDSSAQVLKREFDNVTVITTENRGASAARTTGTEAARGTFIQYLDSDDILAPGTLRARLAALRDSEADVAHSDWQTFSTRQDGKRILGEVRRNDQAALERDAEVATATSAFWAPPAALLYTREIVDRIGGWHPRLPIIQDARFLFDAAAVGARFVAVPGVGAYYRVSDGSLSRRNHARFIADCALNTSEIEQIWASRGSMNAARTHALAEMWGHIATATLVAGLPDFELARAGHNRHGGAAWSFEVGRIARAALGAELASAMARFGVHAKASLRRVKQGAKPATLVR